MTPSHRFHFVIISREKKKESLPDFIRLTSFFLTINKLFSCARNSVRIGHKYHILASPRE